MADAYVKTFNIDQTIVLEDTPEATDMVALMLQPDNPTDTILWMSAFTPGLGHNPDLYTWLISLPLDAGGNYVDGTYNTTGVLFGSYNYSTLNNPTSVRVHGTVSCMYLPVVEPTS